MTEDEQRAEVVKAALSYHGSPWVHMGRSHGGVDCAGLLLAAFADAGLLPRVDTGFYEKSWMLHREQELFLGWVERFCVKRDREPRAGDVALFHFGRCISHGGIVVRWPRIIHAVAGSGCVEYGDCDKGQLAARFRGVWALREWT